MNSATSEMAGDGEVGGLPHLLLIEDNLGDAVLIQRMLKSANQSSQQVEHVQTLSAGLASLRQHSTAAILLDISLPDAQGLEAYQHLSSQHPHIPVIILTGREDEALALQMIHEGAQDYLLKHKTNAELLTHTIRYAVERQKVQNSLNASNHQLLRALKEKEVLLQEIHHRIKNNLQMICSLLSLHASQCQTHDPEAVFTELDRRVRSIAWIHEQLYQSQSLTELNFSQYLRYLLDNLSHSLCVNPEQIRIQLQADDFLLSLNKAVPCGLILNELITNALKHAFLPGQPGSLTIHCHRQGQQYQLVVQDNGKGFSQDWSVSPTLGFTIVHALVRQLDGTLEMEQAAGTIFRLSFAVGKEG